MTYRYLPWVRRGLAASITNPDTLDDRTPELASFPVGVAINNAGPTTTSLRLNGPGDVTGVDTRVITRTDPERFVADFEPNNLATIEFDQPDFPWMFTPAKANAQGRLRPWLVLVVVENRQGVSISVRGDSPLPVLDIVAPAVAADELPNLTDSWAWAHAQVITENDDLAEIADEVANGDDLNLSRIICPRRLIPNRRYFACLVPAFEVGRVAGTGGVPDPDTGLAPAWDFSGGSTAVSLPVYFHWEFGTSNGGSNFEDLVDRLEARELEEAAGTVPMFVGDAGDGIGSIAPGDPGSVLGLEGALRPLTVSAPSLADVPQGLRDDLETRLNATSDHLADGTPPDGRPIGPPLYGSYHAATHELGTASGPAWLEELNVDPRLRAAAALGAEIVRDHQEELMDEAWAQVGDVIAANNALNEAALSEAAAASAYKRHLEPLRDDRLFAVTGPAHARTTNGQGTIKRATDRSRLPNATTDPAFRRVTSPQNRTLKRAARRSGATGQPNGSVDEGIVGRIDDGSFPLEDLSAVPDGVAPSQAFEQLSTGGATVDMTPVGGVGTVPGPVVAVVSRELRNVPAGGGNDLPLRPRSDLVDSGLLTATHIDGVSVALGRKNRQLLARVTEAIAALRPAQGTTGIELVRGPDGLIPRFSGGTDGGLRRIDPGELDPDDGAESEAGRGSLLPIPDKSQTTVRAFGLALREFSITFESDLEDDGSAELNIGGLRQRLLQANDPSVVAVKRTESRVDRAGQVPDEPFDPIMAFPDFPAPLHHTLAEKSRDHFLPGIGDLLPNSFVVVETNPRFVESFLIGANHEMNHELLWREYPTDRRGTPFRFFWDRFDGTADIDEIPRWNPGNAIGENQLGGIGNQIVLLIRAELLQHYPNTIIYAAPALAGSFQLDTEPSNRKDPTMIGRLEPDVTFVMLPITKAELIADPGYYIVFQEQPTELQFGLDSPSAAEPAIEELTTWNDLTWGHADVPVGGHLTIGGNPLGGRPPIEGATFGRNSSDMAKVLLQRPVMVAYHADELLGDLA